MHGTTQTLPLAPGFVFGATLDNEESGPAAQRGTMPVIRLSVAARSDVGRVRTSNEDAFLVADLDTGVRIEDASAMTEMDVRERGVLMVVSDGMGGHAAGEVASALVVDSLRASLGESVNVESMERLVEQAVQRANADVFEAARDKSKEGMGATLTAVLVHKQEAYIAEVGDSRAYVLRQGRLRQMTKDQSFVQVLLDSGAITSEQAKNFANKNWIVQAMGLEPNVHVSLGRLQLRRGDRLLLCCDGLYSHVEDKELGEILEDDNLSVACSRMIDLANERGGSDNVTVIAAKVDGDGLPDADYDESLTQTFEVLKEFKGLPLEDLPGDDDDDDDDDIEEASGRLRVITALPSETPTLKPPPPSTRQEPEAPPEKSSSVTMTVVAVVLLALVVGYWLTR